jgi:hypothetical protein
MLEHGDRERAVIRDVAAAAPRKNPPTENGSITPASG